MPIVTRRLGSKIAGGVAAFVVAGARWATFGEDAVGLADPLHGYWTRPPQDRFTRLMTEVAAGRNSLDLGSEQALLRSLLRKLEVPVSSQMLVFSATSLQKGLINPGNPRALYFNEDTYVGFVPGGRIEVVSLDPDLGGIFYIFDPLRNARLPRAARAKDCMNCHAPHYLDEIPALIIESVVPSPTGGGEKAFRREQSGHGVPLELRFGGWHVTGAAAFPSHWGNIMFEYTPDGRRQRKIAPGELFDLARYPAASSDILPHLLHEHQVGFVNRMVHATYQARNCLHTAELSPAKLVELARPLVRYLLFADEVALPPGGVEGDAAFKAEFLAEKKAASDGASLKDFDLRTRLFRHRCSYMIYSPSFTGLPAPLKECVHRMLARALDEAIPDDEFAYLPAAEKRAIRSILKGTLAGLPADWKGGRGK